MGNLGLYQVMTTLAKRVKGPHILVALVLASGYVIIRPCEAGIKRIIKIIKKRSEKNKASAIEEKKVYDITSSYSDKHGLTLEAGDKLRVLDIIDVDVLLVEKLGDPDNPYCMSPSSLKKISAYI